MVGLHCGIITCVEVVLGRVLLLFELAAGGIVAEGPLSIGGPQDGTSFNIADCCRRTNSALSTNRLAMSLANSFLSCLTTAIPYVDLLLPWSELTVETDVSLLVDAARSLLASPLTAVLR